MLSKVTLSVQCLLLLAVSLAAAYPATTPWSLRGAKQITATQATGDAEAVETVEASNRPWFCRGLDCPEYEVVETKGSLQLRRYKSQCFLVTKVEGNSLLEAQITATKASFSTTAVADGPVSAVNRLVGYLAGENEDGVHLPPTVPLNTVLLTADRHSETVKGSFFFAIYLPEEVQGDAPKPNNREVHLVKLHRRAFWVDTFDCPILTEDAIIRKGWTLIKDLQDMGRKVDTRFFVFSLYEPPLPFVPHHYEIAVRARCRGHGDPPTPSEGDDVPTGDDYPFPEESGGDPEDDECQDDSPDLMDVVASL